MFCKTELLCNCLAKRRVAWQHLPNSELLVFAVVGQTVVEELCSILCPLHLELCLEGPRENVRLVGY